LNAAQILLGYPQAVIAMVETTTAHHTVWVARPLSTNGSSGGSRVAGRSAGDQRTSSSVQIESGPSVPTRATPPRRGVGVAPGHPVPGPLPSPSGPRLLSGPSVTLETGPSVPVATGPSVPAISRKP
jgi:hypothetical protein